MSKYILIVEDDPGIQALLAELLTEQGYAIKIASDSRAALAQLALALPGLLLLGLRLPRLDRAGVVAFLLRQHLEVPILVISAHHDAHRITKTLGAAASLSKPLDIDDLLATVAQLLPQADER